MDERALREPALVSDQAPTGLDPSGFDPARGWLSRRLKRWADRHMESRPPSFVIGGEADPYIRRWWVIPRNRLFNIYLHEIIRSDDDRALHDHPWVNCSILLDGAYVEHRILAGGIHTRALRQAGAVVLRRPRAAHRLEVIPGCRAVSLFITGPVVRSWGFHCPEAGWVHWRDFTAGDNGEIVGRGCGETSFHSQPSSAEAQG